MSMDVKMELSLTEDEIKTAVAQYLRVRAQLGVFGEIKDHEVAIKSGDGRVWAEVNFLRKSI